MAVAKWNVKGIKMINNKNSPACAGLQILYKDREIISP